MGGFFTRTELLTWVASVPAGKAQSGSSLSSQGFRITNLVHVQGVPLLQLVLVPRLQEQAPSVCGIGCSWTTRVMREESSPRGNPEKPLNLAKANRLFSVQLSCFTLDRWKPFLLC